MQSTALLSAPGCPEADEIQAYAEGHLPAEVRRALERHLDGCAECRAVVALLRVDAGRDDAFFAPELLGEGEGDGRLGRYEIQRALGEGGMGRVFQARDPRLSRDVAVKRVRAGAGRRGELQRRLLREAQAMAKVRHPSVVMVLDVGSHEDDVFVAMELVDGVNLRSWLERGPGLEQIVAVFAEAAAGLAAAHRAGLIHRDFKPENVMVTRDGHARVTDFGLACSAWERAQTPITLEDGGSDAGLTELTETGAVLGTPRYMAPEQFLGQPATALADQFAFWVSLHEAIWGVSPFTGRTRAARREAVLEGRRAPRPGRRVPRWLEAAVERGLSREPSRRFATMDEVVTLLSRDLAAEARAAQRRRRARGRALLLGLGGAALGLAVSSTSWAAAFEERVQGLMLARQARPWPEQVVVVAEDQPAVERLGWPPPRAALARVVEAVRAAGAKVVVWDGFFHLPASDGAMGDAAFARALGGGASVVAAPCTAAGGGPQWAPGEALSAGEAPALDCARLVPPVEALRSAASVGHVELLRSPAGNVRGTWALVRAGGRAVPALGLSAWMAGEGHRVLRQTREGLETSAGLIPTGEGGALLVSYRLPWDDAVLSFAGLLDALHGGAALPPPLAERLRGRYVLFGQTAETLHDTAPFADGTRLPAVLLHGMLLGDLLEGRVLRAVPGAMGAWCALAFAVLAVMGALVLRREWALLGLAAVLCGVWGEAAALLREGWLSSPVAASTVVVLAFAAASLPLARRERASGEGEA